MKNTFGHSLTFTLFGESHGPWIGIVIDGLAPGLEVDLQSVREALARRRPRGPLETARREKDDFSILSGVFEGKTTGTPLTLAIPNTDVRSEDYIRGPLRPSHADYTAFCKYHGFEDYRGGGHFSGRLTAALTACGGLLFPVLSRLGITIGTHILQCGSISDRPFSSEESALAREILSLKQTAFPVLSPEKESLICEEIRQAQACQDSIGGITQTAVAGLPAGLGEPWFDSLEGVLSHALFSLGGIKGVSFGDGFGLASLRGSQANDGFRYDNGRVITTTNHNGGINGGISNGMPVLFQCAVKPTPSIAQAQETVDLLQQTDTLLTLSGRHDPAIIRRICPVIDAASAMVLADQLAVRYGTDVLREGIPKCSTV